MISLIVDEPDLLLIENNIYNFKRLFSPGQVVLGKVKNSLRMSAPVPPLLLRWRMGLWQIIHKV